MAASDFSAQTLTGKEREAYLRLLGKEGIPERSRPYYVLRAKEYIVATGSVNPESLDEQGISEVLNKLGRSNLLLDWQFAQLVDAVRIYLVMHLRLPSAT